MKRTLLALAATAAISAISAFSLRSSPAVDLRRFDPRETARIETALWRDYYGRHRAMLFLRLAALLRSQYGQPFLRSHITAFHAARAAFVFQNGKSRADYDKALPDLRSYYAAILPPRPDVDGIARLELEWWILHRQRASSPPGSLEAALARLQARIFDVPPAALSEHAALRAEAMLLRDRRAESGSVDAADWDRIGDLLERSWTSLSRATGPATAAPLGRGTERGAPAVAY